MTASDISRVRGTRLRVGDRARVLGSNSKAIPGIAAMIGNICVVSSVDEDRGAWVYTADRKDQWYFTPDELDLIESPAAPEVAGGGAEDAPWVCPDCGGSTRDAGGMNEEAPEPCMRCFAHWQDSQPAPAPVAAAAPGVTTGQLAHLLYDVDNAGNSMLTDYDGMASAILARFTLTKKETT